MRLHRLRLTAFGPFAARQTVDFDELSAAGLFLLHGPTGGGKTSVLDAVCFALYGQVPGARPATRLRSDHAAPGTPTEVVLELTLAGRRLEITRRPEQPRAKKRGSGVTTEKAVTLLREHRDGQWHAMSKSHQEIGEEIKQLVGMSCEQFCQVVLLPQGEFATFLRASATERAALLGRLFDTRRFKSVEHRLRDRKQDAAQRLVEGDREIAGLAARIRQAAGDTGTDGDPAQAADFLGHAAVLRCAAREQYDIALAALGHAELSHAAAAEAAAQARELYALQQRHEQARRRAAALAEHRPARTAARTALSRAQRATTVDPALTHRDKAAAHHEETRTLEREAATALAATPVPAARRAAPAADAAERGSGGWPVPAVHGAGSAARPGGSGHAAEKSAADAPPDAAERSGAWPVPAVPGGGSAARPGAPGAVPAQAVGDARGAASPGEAAGDVVPGSGVGTGAGTRLRVEELARRAGELREVVGGSPPPGRPRRGRGRSPRAGPDWSARNGPTRRPYGTRSAGWPGGRRRGQGCKRGSTPRWRPRHAPGTWRQDWRQPPPVVTRPSNGTPWQVSWLAPSRRRETRGTSRGTRVRRGRTSGRPGSPASLRSWPASWPTASRAGSAGPPTTRRPPAPRATASPGPTRTPPTPASRPGPPTTTGRATRSPGCAPGSTRPPPPRAVPRRPNSPPPTPCWRRSTATRHARRPPCPRPGPRSPEPRRNATCAPRSSRTRCTAPPPAPRAVRNWTSSSSG